MRRPPVQERTKLEVGGYVIDWIILEWAEYVPGRIVTTYTDAKIPLPKDIQALYDAFAEEQLLKREHPERGRDVFNGNQYKLISFKYDRHIEAGEEIPILRLHFGPTDYFTQKVTDFNLKHPAIANYATAYNPLSLQTIPEFATILGVNVNVLTRDGFLVVTQRGLGYQESPGTYHTSVAENIQRPIDSGPGGAPDPFFAARRGAVEELGIELAIDDITFTAFGINPETYQYSLIGWARTNHTFDDLQRLRITGVPKDKWENDRIIPVPHDPESVAKFVLLRHGKWQPIGLAAVALSLFQTGEFTRNEVHRAFEDLVQHLPR